jgi:transposase
MKQSRTIKLAKGDRKEITGFTRGSTSVRIANRARILLLADEGQSVEDISAAVGCGSATVKRIKARFREAGWRKAITEKPRAGRPKLPANAAPEIIALACTDAPKGNARWTIRLLAQVSGVGRMSVQRILKEDGLKPWREKNVVRAPH